MKSSRLEADEGQLESLLPFWEVDGEWEDCGAEGAPPVQSTSVTWSQIQFPGDSPSSFAISLAHDMEPFLILLPQSLPVLELQARLGLDDNSHIIQNVLSHRKMWKPFWLFYLILVARFDEAQTFPVLPLSWSYMSATIPPNTQKWVQTGKPKVINKQNLQVNGWLAWEKTLVNLSWLEGNIFLLSVWSMLI